MSFCHLHVHSQYSILESSLSIRALAKRSNEYGMKAVALTDHGNLYGAVDFYKNVKGAGVKPIIGCEFSVATSSRLEKKRGVSSYHIVLLAKNIEGYKNLCKLSSIAFLEGFYYVPRIDMEVLQAHSEGLICLSGCEKGVFSQAILKQDDDELSRRIEQYQHLFGDDLYFEIQRHQMPQDDIQIDGLAAESWLYQRYQTHIEQQQKIEHRLREESKKRSIPCVATNNCHYLEREDWRAHEVLLNIQSGETCLIRQEDPHTGQARVTPNPKRTTFSSHEYDFKSSEEMEKRFEDFPEALSVTGEIAEKCNVDFDFTSKHYPVFTCEHEGGAEGFLRQMCEEGIEKRYGDHELEKVAEQYPGREAGSVVKERLAFELDIISSKGLSDYFLLVWDFISWSKRNNIPVGPGRGSVVGSIVSYLIGITDIEPLRFNLLFERFINPGRTSYPDIDVDLCMDKRPDVIAYTVQKYGRENVSQIITFGTMKAKMSVRDVGRVLNVPLSKVNFIAKLIPDELKITIEQALEKEPELKALVEKDEEAASIIHSAQILEGSIRNTGIHAAGLIICGEPLTEHIPICTAKDSEMFATQYSMKPVEQVGMLKVDFLGLKTLTLLQMCSDAVFETHGIRIDWSALPLEDAKTFSLLNHGRTLGVFQIEDGGMQAIAQQLQMDKFEEIIALLSLYRPGPMEMIPSFIARKLGKEPIEFDHPLVETILKETYGIMVYQEQIMQIASTLASYTLGEGDVLRRAMGKKDVEEMARQREKFVKGAIDKGIEEETATTIFDKMEKFAEYGFNKSHATAYGYITYATAYFKAHYPAEWFAALMTGDKADIEKVARIMHESRQMGIECLPPDVNESNLNFTATAKGVRFALSAIKGVGAQAVEALIEERKQGPYTSLYDFVRRNDPKRIGKKMIELLIDAGSFDHFSWKRDELVASLYAMYDDVQRSKKEREQGIMNLFDTDPEEVPERYQGPATPERHRTEEELLFREKELLGMFFGGHPLSMHDETLKRLQCLSISDAEAMGDGTVFRMAFVVESVSIKTSVKRQRKFAILTISDASGKTIEMPVWPDVFEEHVEILNVNGLLWGVFSKERRDRESVIACRWLAELKNTTEKVFEASYEAYEKAKKQVVFRSKRPKAAVKSTEKGVLKKEITTIQFDIDRFRASHVLRLSELFSSSPGEEKVQLAFMKEDKEIAFLQLPLTGFSKPLQRTVEKLPCWISTEYNEE